MRANGLLRQCRRPAASGLTQRNWLLPGIHPCTPLPLDRVALFTLMLKMGGRARRPSPYGSRECAFGVSAGILPPCAHA